MSLALDRRRKLSEQTYEALRGMIMRGEMAPGARISEPEFATRLGISRTPMREALLQLAQEGLVLIYPQSGSFVAPIQIEQVSEAQFIRECLECAVIREVSGRASRRDISILRSLVARQQDTLVEQDTAQFYQLDEELHAAFCEAVGRSGVWRLIQRSKVHMDRVRQLSLPMASQIPRLIQQHRAIVEAVAGGDADRAEAELRGHLREIYATINALQLDAPERTQTNLPREVNGSE